MHRKRRNKHRRNKFGIGIIIGPAAVILIGLIVLFVFIFRGENEDAQRDAETIRQALLALPKPHLIITTEKDAARLRHLQEVCDELRQNTYVLPIEVSIMRDEKNKLDKTIIDYVQENTIDSRLASRKNA